MQRDDRSTELRERQVTERCARPRGIRRKPVPPADLGRRTLKRPSSDPRTPSRHPRRRRTLMLPRQSADRPERAGPSVAGLRRAGETSIRQPFDPPVPKAVSVDELSDCSRAPKQCLTPRRRHCFGRIPRKQCRRPLRVPLPGLPARRSGAPRPSLRDARGLAPGGRQAAHVGPCRVPLRLHGPGVEGPCERRPVASAGDRLAGRTHAGPNAPRPSPWDGRRLAPNGPQAAPVGPCRVLRRPLGYRLEGRPERGPVARVGHRDVASDSAATSRSQGDQQQRQGQRRPARPLAPRGPAPRRACGRVDFAFRIKCEVLGPPAHIAAP